MDGMKPLRWIASAKDDLSAMPTEVRRAVGLCALCRPAGREARRRQVLKGFGDAAVLEIIARHDGETFRAVYTVRFGEMVYVLHVFQKKSKSGIATPKKELELIRKRLKLAERDHKQWSARGGQA
jgi:phage-related protein